MSDYALRRCTSSMVVAVMVAAAIVVAVTVATTPAAANAAPAASLRLATCPTPSSGRSSVEVAGWPQQRYDLAAVSRITRGAGVTVAVVDSGVDASHPQLAEAVRDGGNFLPDAGTGLDDCVGHGTAVASIIAARPLPGAGLRGVAPASTILSIRVSDRLRTGTGFVGTGDVTALVDGIRAAVAARPRPQVINLSISTTADTPALRSAIRAAHDADIVVVAAVGNAHDQGDPTPYPAAYDGVVGVGAIDATGARLASSQVGPYVDLVAPGGDVLTAVPHAGHAAQSGTSFAVPYVAATAALIRARWPELRRAEVVRRLLATADPPAGGQPSPDYGHGVVNPYRAVTEVLAPASGSADAAPTPVVAAPALADARRPGESSPRALGMAVALLLATGTVVALAVAAPAGRRRRWRPGRAE